jgi:hypothetical protein
MTKQSKNYIAFVNDHSGSMGPLASAAAADFNANITAIKDAASSEMLDTVVSVAKVDGYYNPLSVVISNPHVLKPVTHWESCGGTPLWSTTAKLLKMLMALPDADQEHVSFLVMMTTDGEATDHNNHSDLAKLMEPLLATGRWTFVARVPKAIYGGLVNKLKALGIPQENIQYWETSATGMAASTAQTTQAMGSFFRARSAGAKSSSSFYTDASQVNVAALEDISKKISLYVVPQEDNGIEIRPFILRHRMDYLKGAAFYQLTKTEARVGYTKQVLVRDRATGKTFAGKEARKMIGLPSDRNARLHPGDHKNFDLFIQSESINRKLVGGTGVIYWKEIGVPFTADELNKFNGPAVGSVIGAKPAVVTLPAVPVSNAPTKSPIPVAHKTCHFRTREEARRHCAAIGKAQSWIKKDPAAPANKRWNAPAK